MKVILLRDVAKIGKRFEIKEVPDGYALNKLIPAKDAEPATPANVKRVMERHKGNVRTEEAILSEAKAVVESCSASPLAIEVEANEQGHLFQAIHASDVVEVLKQRNLQVALNQLSFSSPVKSLGDHAVSLAAGGQTFSLPIMVVVKQK